MFICKKCFVLNKICLYIYTAINYNNICLFVILYANIWLHIEIPLWGEILILPFKNPLFSLYDQWNLNSFQYLNAYTHTHKSVKTCNQRMQYHASYTICSYLHSWTWRTPWIMSIIQRKVRAWTFWLPPKKVSLDAAFTHQFLSICIWLCICPICDLVVCAYVYIEL